MEAGPLLVPVLVPVVSQLSRSADMNTNSLIFNLLSGAQAVWIEVNESF